jgi:hypothetical protein
LGTPIESNFWNWEIPPCFIWKFNRKRVKSANPVWEKIKGAKFMKKIAIATLAVALLFGGELTSKERILGKVDGKPVTYDQVNSYFRALTGNPQASISQLSPTQLKQVVEDYISTQLLYPYAKKVTSTESYKILAQKLAINLWLKEKLKGVQVSDREIEEFYNKNREKFKTKDGKYIPLEQLKPFIKGLLIRQKINQQVQQLLKKHKVEVLVK